MTAWISLLRGGLLLDTAAYQGLRQRRDAMLIGATLIVIVALLAGLPAFIVDFANGVQARPLTVNETAQAAAGFDRWFNQMAPFLQNAPPEVASSVRQGMEAGAQIGAEIVALPTALPKPISGALKALGGWLSRPFAGAFLPLAAASLATWLGYGVWVMLAAKLLGGHADLREFFGTTALFAGPHLLGVFALIPIAGTLIGILAFAWGLAIYIKATAVSQELSIGRAVLAVLLPLIVALLLALLLLVMFIVLIVSASVGR